LLRGLRGLLRGWLGRLRGWLPLSGWCALFVQVGSLRVVLLPAASNKMRALRPAIIITVFIIR
jgi:hypothetical protein